jgi:hypothetical protein
VEKIFLDGLVLDLRKNIDKARFSMCVWGPEVLRLEDYSQSFEALKDTKFSRFTDNFLQFHVVPGNVDWFNQEFSAVLANAGLAAKIAKEVHFKGILVDFEQYRGKLFQYQMQQNKNIHSLKEYKQQAKKRGREFIQAINAAYPDIIILMPWAYLLNDVVRDGSYNLLPPFLDGILEAATTSTIFYDGGEFAYSFKSAKQFQHGLKLINSQGQHLPRLSDDYRQHFQAAFGLRIDYNDLWDNKDFTKNYFTPEEFNHSLYLALKYTHRYVWIWSEKNINWWNGTMPQPYVDALEKARLAH